MVNNPNPLAFGAEGATSEETMRQVEDLWHLLEIARRNIRKVIFGQDVVVDQTLITLLAGGHALLIGVPGLAKTLLVETLGRVFGLEQGDPVLGLGPGA